MRIYNTLSGTKEEFVPLRGNKVNMYACGITVSGEAHIGHAYQALIYDIIRKFLIKQGYDVPYARNYTDVDDKIIARAKEAGIPADAYAKMMIKKIDKAMREMAIDDPDIWLKATDNIGNIIDFVSELINKGHAYPTSKGDVYFSVESFAPYGRLSHRNLEDALNGVRIENDDEKKNPLDFALWKSAKEGEICWDSPWGKGRPGWHIECSAMNRKAFGEQIELPVAAGFDGDGIGIRHSRPLYTCEMNMENGWKYSKTQCRQETIESRSMMRQRNGVIGPFSERLIESEANAPDPGK